MVNTSHRVTNQSWTESIHCTSFERRGEPSLSTNVTISRTQSSRKSTFASFILHQQRMSHQHYADCRTISSLIVSLFLWFFCTPSVNLKGFNRVDLHRKDHSRNSSYKVLNKRSSTGLLHHSVTLSRVIRTTSRYFSSPLKQNRLLTKNKLKIIVLHWSYAEEED